MDRRRAMVCLATGVATMSAGAEAAAPSLAHRVQTVADLYAKAWNAADMDAMAELYAPEVHWVNIVGMHWRGKAAVDRAHRAYFDIMFKGVPLRLEEIESVTPLAGGGAVAVIRWSVGAFKTPFGQEVPPSRDRMSLVLMQAGERLLIAHGANIQIDEMAQASDPLR